MPRLAIFLFVSLVSAEIIDRIAVTVEKQVITESEIWRQIRITAFLNGEEPDFSSAAKRTMADRLVEQVLIRRELETSSRLLAANATPPTYQHMKARFKTEE
jgi:hypothetical protein